MPGAKPRYVGVASAGPAVPGGVWVTPLAGEIANRTSAVRIERMTQYTGRQRERARSIPGPASFPIGAAQTLRTFCACKPFGPWATSNSTVSPSARLRKPSAWIAVKWTNTSGPDSCAIKPKPFASLNHFTLPFAIPLRPLHNGARPRTGTTHATAVVGRAQTKIRETFGPRGAQTSGDGATYA